MVTQVIQPQINSNEITPGQTFTVNVNYLTEIQLMKIQWELT